MTFDVLEVFVKLFGLLKEGVLLLALLELLPKPAKVSLDRDMPKHKNKNQ